MFAKTVRRNVLVTKELKVILTLASGMTLQQHWKEREVLPESLRGQIAIPIWARNAARTESIGITTLKADVEPGFEADAAHWIGLSA